MENMNIQVLEANNVLTMSSLEIAELTGKRPCYGGYCQDVQRLR